MANGKKSALCKKGEFSQIHLPVGRCALAENNRNGLQHCLYAPRRVVCSLPIRLGFIILFSVKWSAFVWRELFIQRKHTDTLNEKYYLVKCILRNSKLNVDEKQSWPANGRLSFQRWFIGLNVNWNDIIKCEFESNNVAPNHTNAQPTPVPLGWIFESKCKSTVAMLWNQTIIQRYLHFRAHSTFANIRVTIRTLSTWLSLELYYLCWSRAMRRFVYSIKFGITLMDNCQSRSA